MNSFDDAEQLEISTGETTIFLRRLGDGPPLLLLHGFPQTHLMWRDIAPQLAKQFTVICADLRGYGRSGCPSSDDKHTPYSKRVMADDMVCLMNHLGFEKFMVAGHDRGGRVAYRLALDHPENIQALAVLDIIPTLEVWERADRRLAMAYWPWSLLAQAASLPERLILAAPDAIVDDAIGGWGSSTDAFPPHVREAYIKSLSDESHVHAICEEYRAAATLDDGHDRQDRSNGKRIGCPVLVVWGGGGPLDTWYVEEGGPLAIWGRWAADVRGEAIQGGHFFPEENPKDVATVLGEFFSGDKEKSPRTTRRDT